MMGGNPTDWWSMMMMMDGTTAMHSQSSSSSSSSSQNLYGSSSNSLPDNHNSTQDFPRSWSQLLLGGLGGESEKFGMMTSPSPLQHKKMENWEDLQTLQNNNNNPSSSSSSLLRPPFAADNIKQEFPLQINLGRHHQHHHMAAASSLSTHSNNVFNIPSSGTKVGDLDSCKNQHHYYSSECNSTSSGGPSKKPRVHHSSSQPSLKVRKEKLGDRITALHQIVSPFGKTDTASVLSEAIGYIRFLHSQIQALSTPYMGNNPSAGSMARHSHQQSNPWLNGGGNKDLRSKGLCLVPVSCIQHVGSDDGGAAGYWAPAHGGGGF
ncbi:transcription factor bHLH133-like isoform X2 [Ipomoea triloba]|uniref:transcription factor bHLH133-like isoform X2 n=1 Tax=Ipomoea triloba TaxID=35885 RepID=UPI00125D5DA9|nr:transcription factor bHLH133-like isoform X2 [Ipomoea triloba]